MRDLSLIRKDIDLVDCQLVDLLVQRTELIDEVSEFKIKNGLPTRDKNRERELIKKKVELGAGRLDAVLVKKIFKLIMRHSRKKQNNLKK